MLLSKIMKAITMSICSFFELLGRQVLPEFKKNLRSTRWAIVVRWFIPVPHHARLMKGCVLPHLANMAAPRSSPSDGPSEPAFRVGLGMFSECSPWSHSPLPHPGAVRCLVHQGSE